MRNMKTMKKRSGISLIELVVALPMLAFVFLSIAYMLATTGNVTVFGIAKIKTQTAANNVLMLMKAKGYSKLGEVMAISGIDTVTSTGTLKDIDSVEIPKTSMFHPDGTTKLQLSLKREDPPANSNITSGKICVITVTAPDFDNISTIIKTVTF